MRNLFMSLLVLFFVLMCTSCARHQVLRAGNKAITDDVVWVNKDNRLYVCYRDKVKNLKGVSARYVVGKFVLDGMEHPICLEAKWVDN